VTAVVLHYDRPAGALAAVPVFGLLGRGREAWLQARGLFAYLTGSRGRMDV